MSAKFFSHIFTLAFVISNLIPSSSKAAEPYPGYTFFAMGKTAYLYNIDKKIVHQWEVSEGSIQTTPYLLVDGSALFPLNKGGFTFRPGGAHPSGTFQRIGWNGELLWDFSFYGDNFTPSYDIEPMPNGNVLIPAGVKERSMPGKVFEIMPVGKTGGEVVWECNVSEKLAGIAGGYINSVSYNAGLDQVLVNIQRPGATLAIFDHSNAQANLLYKWDQGFSGRLHGGLWITDKYIGTDITIPEANAEQMRAGNIITVSNSDHQAVEIDPRTNTEVKTFDGKFSEHQGSVQRLPNGNTLIVSGYSTVINEVDDAGNVVWSLETSSRVPRAYRYGMNYPGVSKLKTEGK